uniref:Family with sequence similarity 186 member B n=1 Tax=Canis lupus dingo TaxID=286419 RepID=A0A8C0R0N0_CANLU
MEKDRPPQLMTPASVKAIISRIEAAQLTRAQEDISSQLSDILDNVNCVINRFQEELGYDLREKAKSDQIEQKGKNRFILLEKIASFSKDAKTKEKHLYEILRWLGDWGEFGHWVSESGHLPSWTLVPHLLPSPPCPTPDQLSLGGECGAAGVEGAKDTLQLSKHTFWQNWWEQSPPKSTSYPQPLSPEQMLQDKHTTCMKVSEGSTGPCPAKIWLNLPEPHPPNSLFSSSSSSASLPGPGLCLAPALI